MIVEVIVGLIMGAITGMGIGGAGLLVLWLTEFRGLSQLDAQGVNLLFFVASSVAALSIHNRKRRLPLKEASIAVAFAVSGSFFGVRLAHLLPEATVRHIFGWMLIVTGTLAAVKQIMSFLRKRRNRKKRSDVGQKL